MDEYISQAVRWPPDGQLHILLGIALLLGLGKGGIPGLATIATAATVLAAPTHISGGLGYAVALQVPILSMIDIYAAWLHSTALDWPSVWLLLPTSFVGMGIGQLVDVYLTDRGARLLVGCILLGILALRTYKSVVTAACPSWALQHNLLAGESKESKRVFVGKDSDMTEFDDGKEETQVFLDSKDMEPVDIEHTGGSQKENQMRDAAQVPSSSSASSFGWACIVGLVGGAATMLTNSMGPILNVYLLSVRQLTPQAYIGTRAMFFCFINLGKLPMRFVGGTLGWPMIPAAIGLGLVSVVGVFLAKPIMMGMKETTFVKMELAVVAFAGLRLCYMGLKE